MTIPAKHFHDMTPDEQQEVLSRTHPSLLTSGIWVSPGKPSEEEMGFFAALPGADGFRRHMTELTIRVVEVCHEQSA